MRFIPWFQNKNKKSWIPGESGSNWLCGQTQGQTQWPSIHVLNCLPGVEAVKAVKRRNGNSERRRLHVLGRALKIADNMASGSSSQHQNQSHCGGRPNSEALIIGKFISSKILHQSPRRWSETVGDVLDWPLSGLSCSYLAVETPKPTPPERSDGSLWQPLVWQRIQEFSGAANLLSLRDAWEEKETRLW